MKNLSLPDKLDEVKINLLPPKNIKSKVAGLNFTIPESVEAYYSTPYKGDYRGHEEIEFKKGYRMSIDFTKDATSQECPDTPQYDSPDWVSSKVFMGNEIQLSFEKYRGKETGGWSPVQVQKYLSSKQVCMRIYREMNQNIDNVFDQILNSTKFE